jgi:hypothetical protein
MRSDCVREEHPKPVLLFLPPLDLPSSLVAIPTLRIQKQQKSACAVMKHGSLHIPFTEALQSSVAQCAAADTNQLFLHS